MLHFDPVDVESTVPSPRYPYLELQIKVGLVILPIPSPIIPTFDFFALELLLHVLPSLRTPRHSMVDAQPRVAVMQTSSDVCLGSSYKMEN